MRLDDVRDGALAVTQGKAGKKLRIAVEGELAMVLTRIQSRTYKITSLALVRNELGHALSYFALDNRIEGARKRSATAFHKAGNEIATSAVRTFQFRDLRANAGTDKADSHDLRAAQEQLGHDSIKTTATRMDIGSPTRARTWDLRINRTSLSPSAFLIKL